VPVEPAIIYTIEQTDGNNEEDVDDTIFKPEN